MRPFEEPAIGGDRLLVSHADFERSRKVLLWEEQQKLDCNNAVVSVLCNAVRLSREHCRAMTVTDRAERIKALEGELSLANDCVKGLEGNLAACEAELAKTDSTLCETGFADMLTRARKAEAYRDQAQAALKLAHSTLLLFKPSKHQWAAYSNARAAIKACGVEL